MKVRKRTVAVHAGAGRRARRSSSVERGTGRAAAGRRHDGASSPTSAASTTRASTSSRNQGRTRVGKAARHPDTRLHLETAEDDIPNCGGGARRATTSSSRTASCMAEHLNAVAEAVPEARSSRSSTIPSVPAHEQARRTSRADLRGAGGRLPRRLPRGARWPSARAAGRSSSAVGGQAVPSV